MRFGKKQIIGVAIAAMLSLAMVGPAFAANSGSDTVTITTTVDPTLILTVDTATLTIPGALFTCNSAIDPVVVTIISNGAYTGSIAASSSGPIPISSLWRAGSATGNCGASAGVNLGSSAWIPQPAPATSANGDHYPQYYSLLLGFAPAGTTTFTITYSATQ